MRAFAGNPHLLRTIISDAASSFSRMPSRPEPRATCLTIRPLVSYLMETPTFPRHTRTIHWAAFFAAPWPCLDPDGKGRQTFRVSGAILRDTAEAFTTNGSRRIRPMAVRRYSFPGGRIHQSLSELPRRQSRSPGNPATPRMMSLFRLAAYMSPCRSTSQSHLHVAMECELSAADASNWMATVTIWVIRPRTYGPPKKSTRCLCTGDLQW